MNIPINVEEFNGEHRVRDLDLAQALKFERPRKIRELIERHMSALQELGEVRPTMGQTTTSGGRPGKEYHLNEEQAVFICTKSETPKATEVTIEIVKTFVAARRGRALPTHKSEPQIRANQAREARLQLKQSLWFAKQLGLDGNQAILSANRATKALTGVDMMGLLGVVQITATDDCHDINPTEIGRRIGGFRAADINNVLCEYGYQVRFRDYKDRPYYELTDKGRSAGGKLKDTNKKHENGTPVKQLLWSSSVVDALKSDMKGVQA